jgi:hypothetical protein
MQRGSRSRGLVCPPVPVVSDAMMKVVQQVQHLLRLIIPSILLNQRVNNSFRLYTYTES